MDFRKLAQDADQARAEAWANEDFPAVLRLTDIEDAAWALHHMAQARKPAPDYTAVHDPVYFGD